MTAGKPPNSKRGRGKNRGGSPELAAWHTNAARDAGYDVDGINGRGWKRRLAEDTGLAESTVGRYVLAQATPDFEASELLAEALDVKTADVQRAAGYPADEVATPGSSTTRYDSPAMRKANNLVANLRASDDPVKHRLADQIELGVSNLIAMAEARASDGTAG